MTWAFALAVVLAGSVGAQEVTVTALRCEWARDPLGLDVPRPRLSWVLESPRRGTMQRAYQVLVASSESALSSDLGDLWDSGRVDSNRSIEVLYAGRALRPGQRAHWKVRVWNQDDQPSAWSARAWWERSVDPHEWTARWIALPDATRYPDALDLADVQWIGNPEPGAAPNTQDDIRLFRRQVQLPEDRRVRAARLLAAADDRFMLRVNGEWIGAGRGVGLTDLTDDLVAGGNELGFTVSNGAAPAALAARLVVEFETGEPLVISTDTGWQTAAQDVAGRTAGTFAGASWVSARTLGPFGEGFRGDRWFKQAEALARPPRRAPAYLRKSLRLSKPVKSARAYATALGVYELRMNGRRVGEDVLAPGWTDYTKRVQYQTYDVTPLLAQGQNAIGLILGDGWYAGRIGWKGERAHYGPLPMARVELRVEYQDGSTEAFGTDATWTGARGPILYSDLLEGESYDARRERSGWDTSRFVETGWTAASEQPAPSIATVAEVGPPVRRMEELRPKSWAEPAPGKLVFDLGQNMVGWLRLEMKGPAGARVRMRFAEILNPDGTLYTVNLRSARSTDTYVLKGAPGGETFEPRFTFHGFRYVELVGYPGRPGPEAITGIVVRSAIRTTGSLETSDATVNQLQHNIEWGQRGNFLSVPTDCPQRDERLGWMGDAQIFARTACFNGDVASFFTKWMQDVADAQSAEGGFSDVSPRLIDLEDGAPAWGDAGVIVPWTMYQCYGDTGLLADHYDAMARWVRYVDAANPNHLWRRRVNNNYGDWVAVNSRTPKDVLSTAFFAYSTKLLSRAARALGKDDDARRYDELFAAIRVAFDQEFVAPSGRILGETQTAYALALRFGLLPEDKRAAAARHLAEDIERNGGHLTTGFLGVGHLLPALSEAGRDDVAYRLLLQSTFPSWGYSIAQGATTIWERWDGWTQEKGFQDPGMNSFNHYSFGSVGEWMYRVVAGIDTDAEKPGYEHVIVRPRPGGGLTFARGTYDSVRGRIATEWRIEGRRLTLRVEVPANTTATVYVPGAGDRSKVTEGGVPADTAAGVRFLGMEGPTAVYAVGSGTYLFIVDGFGSD